MTNYLAYEPERDPGHRGPGGFFINATYFISYRSIGSPWEAYGR